MTQYRLTDPPPRVDASEGSLDVAPGDVPHTLELEGLSWEFAGWDEGIALYHRARGAGGGAEAAVPPLPAE